MNDKGHFHSYEMAAEPSEDLPAALHAATALPVERSGAGRRSLRPIPAPPGAKRMASAIGGDVEPVHVAACVEDLQLRIAAPSVKLRLAGIRMLFGWLVVGQVIPANPASAVRGPKQFVKKGKTPVLTAGEARDLLDRIVTDTLTASAIEPSSR